MLGLFGCGSKKYKVDYSGQKDWYENAKDEYRAGENVVIYFKYIATDTDYKFYLDGAELDRDYDEKKGFILSFTMPERDVSLKCESHNSMIDNSFTENTTEPEFVMLIDYYHGTVGTADGGSSYELVLGKKDGNLELDVYRTEDGVDKPVGIYTVDSSAEDECFKLINDSGFDTWKDCDEDPIEGAETVLKYLNDDGSYTRVSTDRMPDGGEAKLNAVKAKLESLV